MTSPDISSLVDEGMTCSEAAEHLGVSDVTARKYARELGIKFTPLSHQTLRQRVGSMKPLDAVEYLLAAIEQLEVVKPLGQHAVDVWGIHFTVLQRRILVALYEARGVLTHDAIYNAMYFDRPDADDLPDEKIVAIMICKIRAKLPENIARIENAWGVGYRMMTGPADAQTHQTRSES